MARYAVKSPRRAAVREAAATYGDEGRKAATAPTGFMVTMADRGRLVLPAEVRERLNIKEGDRLTLRLELDGTIKLQTPMVFARSLRGIFKHLAPGRSLVDELIAERRREAAIEDRKDREFIARQRRKGRR